MKEKLESSKISYEKLGELVSLAREAGFNFTLEELKESNSKPASPGGLPCVTLDWKLVVRYIVSRIVLNNKLIARQYSWKGDNNLERNIEKIDKLINKIKCFFSKKQNIAAVYLFGSFGTEYENKFSDIDLGIIFMPGVLMGLQDELDLEARLSLYLKTDNIDLVNLNKAPLYLRFQAITDGKLIYEKDYIATSNFIENTYRYYFDYSYHLKIMKQERTKSLKEAYANG